MAFGILCLSLVPALAQASTYLPDNLKNDVYGVAQGGGNNGIPTANDTASPELNIYQVVNHLIGTSYIHNAQLDNRFVEPDYAWKKITESSGTLAVISLSAGYANRVGIYTDLATGGNKTELMNPGNGNQFTGNGTSGNPYPAAQINAPSFGLYLNANGSSTYYYSDPLINPQKLDHMLTFKIEELRGQTIWVKFGGNQTAQQYTFTNPYLVAWEDLPWASAKLGDEDYNDMTCLVDRVAPVPLPSAVLLLAPGLASLGMLRRRETR